MKLSVLVAAFSVCLSLPTVLVAQEDPGFSAPAQKSEQRQPIQPPPETIGKIELKDNLKDYSIWLLIQPQGVRFLQSEEEIAIHQNQIPVHAFLVGCQQASFEANTISDKREFQLTCQDFALLGHYGTTQFAEMKGMSLSYSTQTKQIQLKGDKDAPVEVRLNGESSETLMQADEITLTLRATFIQRQAVLAGSSQEVTFSVPKESSFQLSAEKIVSLEIHPSPALQKDTDSPKWNPEPIDRSSNVPFFDPPSSPPMPIQKRNALPTY